MPLQRNSRFFGWFFEWPWPRPLRYQGNFSYGTLCRSKETAMFSGLVLSMALAATSDVPEQVCFFLLRNPSGKKHTILPCG
jgi:hypothetical protein